MARKIKAFSYAEATVVFLILRNIGLQKKNEPLTKRNLSELLGLNPPDITKALNRMKKLELVKPYAAPIKGTFVEQTTKGKAFVKAYTTVFGEEVTLDS